MQRTIYFQGGLGNQMFQYAFYRYLEHVGERDVVVSLASPSLNRHQGFELFRIFPNINQNPPKIVSSWVKNTYYNIVFGVRNRVQYAHPYLLFENMDTNLDAEHLNLHNARLLMGYWQNNFYSEQVRDILLKDFSFKPFEEAENIQLAKLIKTVENPVSLHIRRGDYFQKNLQVVYGSVCSLTYYKNAISYLQHHVNNPVFFVFSDDPDWVKANLHIENAHYIAHNKGANAFRDMQLMSLCKHHVIANSSFSWWGAWLNPNPEKIIVAPDKWYNKPKDQTLQHLSNEKWILMQTNE